MNALKLSCRHWISKHTAGCPPVGTVLLQRCHQEHSKCPRCGKEETLAHVWECCHPSAIETWRGSISVLQTWLETLN